MTAKRFILDEYLGIGSVVIDTENENVRFRHENELSMKQCCDLLNEQHEQIQELIQSSKELEEDCQSTFNAMSRKQDDLYRKNFKLKEENEQLKKELKVYRKVASCRNCHYHNYDWFDDGDEFEVCDKGNDVTEGICEDWEEL